MELVPDTECIHGLTVRTCGFCLGRLRSRPYRQALEKVMPGFLKDKPIPRRDCELCGNRPASIGNRIFVRLPRPPRKAWGQDVPPYPPSFSGPLVEAPRIYKATHRRKKDGRYACDRCDPWGRPAEKLQEPKTKTVLRLTTEDVFV